MKLDPVAFVMKAHNSNVLVRNIQTFGNSVKTEFTVGAVSKIGFGKIEIIENEMPINKSRVGRKMESVEFIVVHDTGNNNLGATAYAHNRYLKDDPGVSYHYVVDEKEVYHNMPDDEVGYHAGDGLRDFGLTNTGVKATNPHPQITIENGVYVINDESTNIKAPLVGEAIPENKDITPAGIFTIIGEDGNYYLNNTYFNKGYQLIANCGGGTRGIGIESCVNEGGSLFATWQNLAKLVAKLLVENQLGLDRVMQHNHFSGKPCPQTLRTAELWPMFMEMVACEYQLITTYRDYQFTLVTNDAVNEFGRVIKDVDEVKYKVIIDGKNYHQEVELVSKIKK